MIAVRDTYELNGNAHAFARYAYAALEDRSDIKGLADLGDGRLCPLEREGGRASGYAKPSDLRENIDQLFSETVREILAVLITAHVDERQYGDRAVRRRYGREHSCLSLHHAVG